MMYRKFDKEAAFPTFPVRLKVGPDKEAPAVDETPTAPGEQDRKGWDSMGMSYSTWNKLMADPNAKEFVTFHTEMSNGGFAFFYNQHSPENGAKYNIERAKDFVLKFAPGHYKMFSKIVDAAYAKAKSGDYGREDDAQFSKEYKTFSGAMEMEIEGKWTKQRKIKPKEVKDEKRTG